MNITEREDRYYWHVHVDESSSSGSYSLHTKGDHAAVDLTPYVI